MSISPLLSEKRSLNYMAVAVDGFQISRRDIANAEGSPQSYKLKEVRESTPPEPPEYTS